MKRMRGYMDPEFVLAVIIVAFVVGIPMLAFMADKASCVSRADSMRLPYRWGPLLGCMVKVDGSYVPLEAVRYVNGRMKVEQDAP